MSTRQNGLVLPGLSIKFELKHAISTAQVCEYTVLTRAFNRPQLESLPQVLIPSCSSDLFVGDRHGVDESSGLHFAGRCVQESGWPLALFATTLDPRTCILDRRMRTHSSLRHLAMPFLKITLPINLASFSYSQHIHSSRSYIMGAVALSPDEYRALEVFDSSQV